MAQIPQVRKFEGGVFAHYYTTAETFRDEPLSDAIASLAAIEGVLSPVVVLPDVSHKADRISPTGMTLATRGAVVPAAVPAANGSGIRLARLDLSLDDPTDAAALAGDFFDHFLQLLGQRVPIYGEDSPALVRGRLREEDLLGIYRGGAPWLRERMKILPDEPFDRVESGGCVSIEAASDDEFRRFIPDYFFEQGLYDFGILESGNHFIEVQVVEEILDAALASRAGLEAGQVMLMIHDGSPASLVGQYFQPRPYAKARERDRFEADKRAYHARFVGAPHILEGAGSRLNDERFFSPVSPYFGLEDGTEAHRRFMALMGMACNFGFANRLYLQHAATESLRTLLGRPSLQSTTLTDTLHDCVKRASVSGESVMVHRHGASEARPASCYSPGALFAETGQLIGIPGAPGRASYLAAAQETAASWHTLNHGAGRKLDRSVARKRFDEAGSLGVVRESGARLLKQGLGQFAGEHPAAYKDVDEVLSLASDANLLRRVARMRPIAIYKG